MPNIEGTPQGTQSGVWFTKTTREFKNVPIYHPDEGEVLIKNVAVASNPKDWKVPLFFQGWESIEGNDVAGVVAEVGAGVTDFKVGDSVAAFTKMKTHPKFGGYQQYTVAPVETTFPLPPNCTYEQASTYPLAYMTAGLGLFRCLNLPTPPSSQEANTKTDDKQLPIIVYGASSSVGSFALQLAKLARIKVIAVAGSSKDIPVELGADSVIDYRGKTADEIAQELQHAYTSLGGVPDDVPLSVYDAVTQVESLEPIVKFLSSHPAGGTITTVLPTPSEIKLPENGKVKIIQTRVALAHGEETEFAKKWFRWLGQYGKVKPNKVLVLPNGLRSVEEGVQMLKDGKVSGKKLVYRISETPGL